MTSADKAFPSSLTSVLASAVPPSTFSWDLLVAAELDQLQVLWALQAGSQISAVSEIPSAAGLAGAPQAVLSLSEMILNMCLFVSPKLDRKPHEERDPGSLFPRELSDASTGPGAQ